MADLMGHKLPSKNVHPRFTEPPSVRQRVGGLGELVYRNVFRRTSTFVLSIMLGAFFFERAFDKTGNMIFETANKGKLWKDIKHNYEGKTPAADEAGDEAAPGEEKEEE